MKRSRGARRDNLFCSFFSVSQRLNFIFAWNCLMFVPINSLSVSLWTNIWKRGGILFVFKQSEEVCCGSRSPPARIQSKVINEYQKVIEIIKSNGQSKQYQSNRWNIENVDKFVHPVSMNTEHYDGTNNIRRLSVDRKGLYYWPFKEHESSCSGFGSNSAILR